MKTSPGAWTTLCALAIAGIAAANVADVVRRAPPPPHAVAPAARDVVGQQEHRFARLREALAARRISGALGYLADLSPADLSTDDQAMQDYFVSQFVLAPWVLEAKFKGHGWVVANLRKRPPAERVPHEYEIVEDCGGGVLLLRLVAHRP